MESDFFFLHGANIPRCNLNIARVMEGYYTLQFVAAGAMRVDLNGKNHILRGPHLWCCGDGDTVKMAPHPDSGMWNHRYVAFMGPRATRWIAEGLYRFPVQKIEDAARFADSFDKMLVLSREQGPWQRCRAANLLENILLELAELRSEPAHPGDWLNMVCDAISNQPLFDMDYAVLAAKAGMGLSTLRAKFKARMGKSIHDYTIGVRIARAQQLLHNTKKPLQQIAEELGYGDVYFLSRQFKQITGLSPRQFRQGKLSKG